MGQLVFQAALGGQVNLAGPNTASTFTATLPAETGTVVTTGGTGQVSQPMLATGVAGTGPAFSATKSGSQTGISNATFQKVTFETEVFDTNNNFASSRFTPTVAGYYQINTVIDMGSTVTYGNSAIAKNGTAVIYGSGGTISAAAELISVANGIIYCNGSTDYIEIQVYVVSTSNVVYPGGASFSGAMVRGA
jgi:hypothetical protein